MARTLTTVTFLALATVAWAYSGGAPVDVCEDMTPKHPAAPQTSDFPYTVSVNSNELKSGGKAEITISGRPFKGFLLQVRDGDKPVGSFNIPDDHKYAKSIDCSGGRKSAATHKNSADKKSLTLEWVAPRSARKTYTIYATVAENGGVYWVRQPSGTIKVN